MMSKKPAKAIYLPPALRKTQPGVVDNLAINLKKHTLFETESLEKNKLNAKLDSNNTGLEVKLLSISIDNNDVSKNEIQVNRLPYTLNNIYYETLPVSEACSNATSNLSNNTPNNFKYNVSCKEQEVLLETAAAEENELNAKVYSNNIGLEDKKLSIHIVNNDLSKNEMSVNGLSHTLNNTSISSDKPDVSEVCSNSTSCKEQEVLLETAAAEENELNAKVYSNSGLEDKMLSIHIVNNDLSKNEMSVNGLCHTLNNTSISSDKPDVSEVCSNNTSDFLHYNISMQCLKNRHINDFIPDTEHYDKSVESILENQIQPLADQNLTKILENDSDNEYFNAYNDAKNSSEINYENYQHVLELYNFPKEIQTSHLEEILSTFESSGFILKWVNENHCLAVFPSVAEAKAALSLAPPFMVKLRPMSDASPESKAKLAYSPGDWRLPYKRRPATDSRAARRIISHHLGLSPGVQGPATPDALFRQAKAEARLQQERLAKEEAKKRLQLKLRLEKAIWEDD